MKKVKVILLLLVISVMLSTVVFAATNKPADEMLKGIELKALYATAGEKALELRHIAYILIAFFIFLALATAYIKMMTYGVFEFYPVIVRSIFGLILLAGYTQVINLPLAVVDGLSKAITEEDMVVTLYEKIINNNKAVRLNADQGVTPVSVEYEINKINDKVVAESRLDQLMGRAFVGWFTRKANAPIYFMSTIIISTGITIMGIIRHFILGFLIVIGVLLIPFIVWPQISKVTRGWFIALIETACWVIVWKILLLLGLAFLPTLTGMPGYREIVKTVCYNYAFGVLLIATPAIIHALVSGTGLGNVLSIAGGAAVAKVSEMAGRWHMGQGPLVGGAGHEMRHKVAGEIVDKFVGPGGESSSSVQQIVLPGSFAVNPEGASPLQKASNSEGK